MSFSISRFSIRRQMLIGYTPVLVALAVLAWSSFQNFREFESSFAQLQNVTKENISFLEIEKDIVELQRNVAVYSYLGYQGIVRKVEFLEKQLEVKFLLLQPIIQDDVEISELLSRMEDNFNDYKVGFDEAIKEYNKLKAINKDYFENIYQVQQNTLSELNYLLMQQGDIEALYMIVQIENHFLEANSKIDSYRSSPDGILLNEAKDRLLAIQDVGNAFIQNNAHKNHIGMIRNLVAGIEGNLEALKELERVNRGYLQLINVVLAGKAAEIDKLSGELDTLVRQRSESLTLQISNTVTESRNQFILFSIITGLLGIVSSLFIAMGITNPVTAMATTLSKLATGKADIEIPGLNRKDEVGEMAVAANEFKNMASQLKNQTEELEEFSYRTSHDLRSPLKSTIGLLKVAENSIQHDKKEETFKILDIAISSLSKLDLLVQDILVLTKVKNEEEESQLLDIEKIVNEAVEKLSYLDNFSHLDVKVNLNYKGELFAKKTRVVLVVENLIANAIKYQDMDKNNSFVEISASKQNDDFVLSVKDNGLGIPAGYQDKLFMMFKRFHPKISFGSGLGLYMIKKSADILRGKIIYEDTGDGSLFKLIIPTHSYRVKAP